MNKIVTKILKYGYLALFLLLEIVLYFLFLFEDYKGIGVNSTILKYESIILVNVFLITTGLFSILLGVKEKKKGVVIETTLMIIAIIFTLLSDTFLMLIDSYYEVGVSFFVFVQIAYFLRIIFGYELKKKEILRSLISRIIVFFALFILLIILSMFEYLYIVTVFYFTNLIFNFIDSLVQTIKRIKNNNRYLPSLFFSLGLLLFILCDISVGLSNLFDIMGTEIWLFYLPSQVLITISGIRIYNQGLLIENE